MGFSPFKIFKKVVREVKRVFRQITDVFTPEIPEPAVNQGNESRGILLNLESNNAPIPVIYGERKVGGTRVFKATSGTGNEFLYVVLVLGEGEVDSINDIYIDDIDSTDARYSGFVTINKYTGTDSQTADSMLVAAGIGWTTAHRLRGVAYLACRFKWSPDAFRGEPVLKAMVKGKKVLDTRTSSTAWSDNPALCLYDYLTNARYGKGLAADQLLTSSFNTAADDCEDQVTPYSGGADIDRFTCNAVIDTGRKVTDNVRDLLFGMRGLLPWTEGKYSLLIEGTGSGVLSFGESQIVGGIKVEGTNKRNRFNRAVATFTNPDKNHQDDEVQWPDPGSAEETNLLADDNGFVSKQEIRLRTVTNKYTARDLAKLVVKRSRVAIGASVRLTSEGIEATAGDIISLTHSSPAWSGKLFRIKEMSLHSNGEVSAALVSHDDSVYAWDETSQQAAAPATNFPDPFTVQAPSGLAAASGDAELLIPGDGTVVTRMLVTWNAPSDAFVTNYELEFKISSESDYTRIVLPGSSLSHYIFPVTDGATYDVRLRSKNIAQAGSSFVTLQHVVAGKSAAPSAPNSFTVARQADGTREFEWVHGSVPADVRVGGGYRIKYQTGGSITWSSASLLHTGLLLASPFESNQLAAGQYTFEIRAVDSSGNESATGQTITATLGDPRLREVLVARIERALGWPGSKTDCFVNYEGALESVGAAVGGQWDDLPATWADLPDDWTGIVASASPIVYETPEIDLGVDVTFNPLATFDGVGTAVFKMKSGTAADGSVTGSWVDLAQLIGKRYFQLQMTVTGTDVIANALILLLDGEREIDEFEDVATGSAADAWFESIAAGHFKIENTKSLAAISQAQITAIQNVGAGWTWELISKNTTITSGSEVAAEFKIYNSSGTLADATVDVQLRGPKA